MNNHQSEIKCKISNAIDENKSKFFGLTGAPGTGKTLLLYDIATTLSTKGKVLVIHCGILSPGHQELDNLFDNINIIPAGDLRYEIDLSQYKYILVDETHRMYWPQFEDIVKEIDTSSNAVGIFSYDINQTLSKYEVESNIAERISKLASVQIFELSDKIRTNPEISSFIKRLLDLTSHDIKNSYPSIDLVFAESEQQITEILKHYQQHDYTFIRYSGSNFSPSIYDNINHLTSHDFDTHHVIGQEYDKVVMVLGKNFQYNDEKKLISHQHPNPDYLYRQLLFQGLTRTREKLAIIVWDNKPLFEALLAIVQPKSM